MLEDFKEPAPEGAELEAFLSAPKHHLARLIRDLFSEEASATTMEVSLHSLHIHSSPPLCTVHLFLQPVCDTLQTTGCEIPLSTSVLGIVRSD